MQVEKHNLQITVYEYKLNVSSIAWWKKRKLYQLDLVNVWILNFLKAQSERTVSSQEESVSYQSFFFEKRLEIYK